MNNKKTIEDIEFDGDLKGIPLSMHTFNDIGKEVPQYKESVNASNDWVNFGIDNLMPNYLISLIDSSPKHNAIINQKANMIGGNGIVKTHLSNEALSFIANSANGMDLEELLARIAYDLEVFGSFAINVIWSKDRTRIAELNYISPQQLRIQAPDSEYPQIENYWICKDWKNPNKNKPVLYPGFSVIDRSNPSQILYVKKYQAGRYFYGSPEYLSGARWISMEYEISNFHLNNIKNGFAPSFFINFPTGIPTDEEMSFNDRKLTKQLAGPKGGGKAFITYSEDKDSAPSISPLDSNSNDTKFIDLNEIITEGILGAHRVNDPALFGLNTGLDGGLQTSQTAMLNSLELFRTQYIVPQQRFIEKCFNRLARINGITDYIEIAEYSLNFAKMDVSIQDVLSILSAPISDVAKRNMLIINGYTEEDANKIVISQPSPEAPKNNPTTNE